MPLEFGQVSQETRKLRALIEDVARVGAEGHASIDDVNDLIRRIDTDFSGSDDVFIGAARALLAQIAEDGDVSEGERRLLSQFATTFDEPITDEPVTEVAGRAFVLTGDFAIDGGKATIADMIDAAGGTVKGGVSKKVAYVVVGSLGSEAWAFGGYGQKVKKALDFRLTGKADIKIVAEGALMSFFEGHSDDAMGVLREKEERYRRQWDSARVVAGDFNGLTDGQRRVFDLVKEGRNVYLTGLGGTGKSYVLEQIIEWAKGRDRNVIVCAPTGIAALNVGGCTVHRALGISPDKTMQIDPYPYIPDNSPLLECDLMIVDEISMCRMDLFDYLSKVLKKAGNVRAGEGKDLCQLVVVGDFCQLPPVLTSHDRPVLEAKYGYDVGHAYPFMGVEWETWDFQTVELTEAIRQRDADFVAALNACRVGDTNGLHWIEEHAATDAGDKAIVLCGKNEEAERENRKRLDAINTPAAVYSGRVDGDVTDADLPTARSLKLKPGARVMALVNRTETTFMNGSLGTVCDCWDDCVTVRFDNGYLADVGEHRWEITKPELVGGKTKMQTIGTFTQVPLKLAYAMTIHKSQGQTFDSAVIYPRCWDPGQLYTALSRLTSIKGLVLAHSCPDSSLVTSREVIDFYEGRPIERKPIGGGSVEQSGERMQKATPADGRHDWTAEDEALILGNPTMTARELGERIGVTAKAVERRRAKLRRRAER